jgi:hypothetical protein
LQKFRHYGGHDLITVARAVGRKRFMGLFEAFSDEYQESMSPSDELLRTRNTVLFRIPNEQHQQLFHAIIMSAYKEAPRNIAPSGARLYAVVTALCDSLSKSMEDYRFLMSVERSLAFDISSPSMLPQHWIDGTVLMEGQVAASLLPWSVSRL